MKPKNNHVAEKDCCSLCEDANSLVEKMEEKKVKERKSWNWKKLLPITGLSLVLLLSVKAGSMLNTKLQTSFAKKPKETAKALQVGDPRIGSLALDFVSEDVSGKKIALSDFRGKKPVLLIFWATWCGYCAKELPDLKTFTQKHQDEIQVLVVSSGESREIIKDYIQENDINFSMLLDEQKEIWNSYLVRGTPTHFLIDKAGKIVTLRLGLTQKDGLEVMLTMVLI